MKLNTVGNESSGRSCFNHWWLAWRLCVQVRHLAAFKLGIFFWAISNIRFYAQICFSSYYNENIALCSIQFSVREGKLGWLNVLASAVLHLCTIYMWMYNTNPNCRSVQSDFQGFSGEWEEQSSVSVLYQFSARECWTPTYFPRRRPVKPAIILWMYVCHCLLIGPPRHLQTISAINH